MPRYKLMASCGWIAGSTIEVGEGEFENEDEAGAAAWDAACNHFEVWTVLMEDDDE